ncbi:hypothetical protein BaRGS_00013284 [Batillaria attramentaria]|uniref:Uncharacterized protein n=1 Tax=Batillaria attramentaria TaxID=370345 RepID=A0ABD0L8H2_9CAEN
MRGHGESPKSPQHYAGASSSPFLSASSLALFSPRRSNCGGRFKGDNPAIKSAWCQLGIRRELLLLLLLCWKTDSSRYGPHGQSQASGHPLGRKRNRA